MNKYTFLLAGSVLLLTGCAGVKATLTAMPQRLIPV